MDYINTALAKLKKKIEMLKLGVHKVTIVVERVIRQTTHET
jgi:hypothetical protein